MRAALVETSGIKAEVSNYMCKNDALEALLNRYFSLVKEADRIDWRCTWIDLDEGYAKVDTWFEVIELRVTNLRDQAK